MNEANKEIPIIILPSWIPRMYKPTADLSKTKIKPIKTKYANPETFFMFFTKLLISQ
jgi:hypothetical protein